MLCIYIPTYKRKQQLRKLLYSITQLSSEVKNFLVITISDNNSGNVLELENIKKDFNDIDINVNIQTSNVGARANIEYGFINDLSKYEYIFPIGDDDEICVENFEEAVKILWSTKPDYLAYTEACVNEKLTYTDLKKQFAYQIGNLGTIIIRSELFLNARECGLSDTRLSNNVWVTTAYYLTYMKGTQGQSVAQLSKNETHAETMLKNADYFLTCFIHFWILLGVFKVSKLNRHYLRFLLGNLYSASLHRGVLGDEISFKDPMCRIPTPCLLIVFFLRYTPRFLILMMISLVLFVKFKGHVSSVRQYIKNFKALQINKRTVTNNALVRHPKDFF